MVTIKNIGFIGLGNMGVPMATNLVNAGFSVQVYNRNAQKAKDFQQTVDIQVADTVASLVSTSDVIITMLSNDAAVQEVYGNLFAAGAGKASIYIDMSTVSPETTRQLAATAAEKGISYLDAPVSGSVKPATERQLIIMVGGDAAAFDQVQPVFAALGKSSTLLGASGAGNIAKLAINLFLGITIQGLSEAVVFAAKNGISAEDLLPLINNGPIGSGITKLKTSNIVNEDYTPAFALKLLKKDIGLAEAMGMDTPTGKALSATLIDAVEKGLGDDDMVAIHRYLTKFIS
ncbi:NAD(P)-dependent oxidoreductase [Pedobacter duraquae]|uniref:3-hydroxyisobutyrate dehydrogenase n=1 Tax=Pedobacter duraquae TaxID=425511 RepID=A0A4R6IP78_9SPHI|nr:NAD(P)-dependent oxidoreductase [Pedobacter duraquae]TDO23997.1 3-hydroxyisobutyrate dehydrogenase [Pedobacter duraquae]